MSPDALSRANLRVDPMSRCGALLLPMDSIAILPFFQTQVELELPEQDQSQAKYASGLTCRAYFDFISPGMFLIRQVLYSILP